MKKFYAAFLKWREMAGMDNEIGDHLAVLFQKAGFKNVEVLNSDEHYNNSEESFPFRAAIWTKVAGLTQIVEEGHIPEIERLKAIEDYEHWINSEGRSMTLRLNETRGII
jgi:hypothetical protein